MTHQKKKLGELLVQNKVIDEWQLHLALEAQANTNEAIGEIMVKKGWVSEDQVLQSLSSQFEIPYRRLDAIKIDEQAVERYLKRFPEDKCFPVAQDAGAVTVAVSDPRDEETMSAAVGAVDGQPVRFVLSTKTDIQAAIQRFRARMDGGQV